MALIPVELGAKMQAGAAGAVGPEGIIGLCNAISEYIITNATFMGTFNGIGPPPASAPVVAPVTARIISCTVVGGYVPGLAELATKIQTGVAQAQFMYDPPFSGATGVLGISSPLILTPTGTNDPTGSMLSLANQICLWLQAWTVTVPCVGIVPPAISGMAMASSPIL